MCNLYSHQIKVQTGTRCLVVVDLKIDLLSPALSLDLTTKVCKLVQQLPLTCNKPFLSIFALLRTTPLHVHRISQKSFPSGNLMEESTHDVSALRRTGRLSCST